MKSPVGWPPRVSTLPSLHVARTSSMQTVRLIKDSGGQAAPFAMDVSNPGAVQQLIDAVERDAGSVDLLVNNAAVIPSLGRFGRWPRRTGGDSWRSTSLGHSSALGLSWQE